MNTQKATAATPISSKLEIKEVPAVAVIRDVVARFVSPIRAFSSKNRVREARVAKCNHGFVLLLPRGRWTSDARDVDEVIAYKPYREHREEGWVNGRRVRKAQVDEFLNALAELGVVSMEDVRAFRIWKRSVIDRRYAAERLVKAEQEVAKLREEVAGV